MPSKKTSVLVVDDDARMLHMMQRMLELEGYRVLTANNGEGAITVLDDETPDLILLDIMMPGLDGYAVCQLIREFSQIPIIMVTAKADDAEKVRGLDAGADDYVTKPFSARELTARVRAVLRRAKFWDECTEPEFRLRDLVIDFVGCRVTVGSQEIDLTATEYRLLSYLARNAGRLVTLSQILEKVWGDEYTSEAHLLQVNVARLRRKLKESAKNPSYILTRPGTGYVMTKES